MPLSRGKVLGYNFDRQTIEFTMFHGVTGVRCAVEAGAMDKLERPNPSRIRLVGSLVPERMVQFERLRGHIEQSASRKFSAGILEEDGTVLVRGEDI
jgi:hypothetical protein